MSRAEVVELLRHNYSSEWSPVASAGGLYPVVLSVLLREKEGWSLGRWGRAGSTLEFTNDTKASEEVAFALDQEECLHGAAAVFVIAGDYSVSTYKYAARGYRFALLEAGHVSQMLQLAAAEANLGSLEFGGFRDEALQSLVGTEATPIVTVAVGRVGEGKPFADSFEGMYLELTETLKPRVVVDSPAVVTGQDAGLVGLPVNLAVVEYSIPASNQYYRTGDSADRYGAGSGASRPAAAVRALGEAYERHCSGNVRIDVRQATADEVMEASGAKILDARDLYPVDRASMSLVDFLEPYNPTRLYDWVFGESALEGDLVAAPIDCIYYPLSAKALGRRLVASATSSGVAAHWQIETARNAALLELIERDAFMRAWLGQSPPPRADNRRLPQFAARRLNGLERNGYSFAALLLPSPVPVVMVVLRSSTRPALVCGAAASLKSLSDALDRAMDEALASLVASSMETDSTVPSPDTMRVPRDRILHYHDPGRAESVDGFLRGAVVDANWTESVDLTSTDMLEAYRPAFFDLALPGAALCIASVHSLVSWSQCGSVPAMAIAPTQRWSGRL